MPIIIITIAKSAKYITSPRQKKSVNKKNNAQKELFTLEDQNALKNFGEQILSQNLIINLFRFNH